MHARHCIHLESAQEFLDTFLDMHGAWQILDIIQHASYLTHECPHACDKDVILGAKELRYAA
jgi:hypothetical protein